MRRATSPPRRELVEGEVLEDASPEAAAAVNASHANGQKLEVNSTPTVFVNGRRMVGADAHLLEQYIKYELARLNKSAEKR